MTPRSQTPDPLREILHRGDPAGDGETLAPADAGRIRRAALARLAERGRGDRRLAPVPALAAALAAIGLAVVVGVPWWRQQAPEAPKPAVDGAGAEPEVAAAPLDPGPSTRPEAAEPGPALGIGPGPGTAPQLPSGDPPGVARAGAAEPARVAAAPGPRRAIETPPPGVAAERQRRRIEFAAPGGTRVVWVLDTGFTL